jgi:hypothetical protein
MEIETELLQLLMEAGYLAGGYGYFKESRRIFDGIAAVRPDSELPFIGMAVSSMNAGNNHEAIKILWEKALKTNPESDLAKSFLGLSLKLSGLNNESQTILQEVIDSRKNEVAVKMAQSLMNEMEP